MTRRNGYLALSSAIALSVSVGSLGFPSGDAANQFAMLKSDCSGLKLSTRDRSIVHKLGDPINRYVNFNVTGASSYSMIAPDASQFGMNFEPDGSFSWDTTGRRVGNYEITIQGNNGADCGRISINLQLAGNSTNQAPKLSNPGSARMKVGESRVVTLKGRDKEGDAITYQVSGDLDVQPSDTKANEFTITAMPGDEIGGNGKGLFSMIASASDGNEGGTTEKIFKIKVSPNLPRKAKNKAPRFVNLKAQTAALGQQLDYGVTVTDDGLPSGSTLSYSILRMPEGETARFEGSHFLYTPSSSGSKIFQIGASDGSKAAKKIFRVNVLANGSRPEILSIDGITPSADREIVLDTIGTGEELSFTVDAEDADGYIESYRLVGAPANTFDKDTGEFSWTPTDARRLTMYLTVTDNSGLTSDRIKVLAESINDADPTPPTAPTPRLSVYGVRGKYVIDEDTVNLKVTLGNPQDFSGCNVYFGVYHRPVTGPAYSVYGSDYTAGWLLLSGDQDVEFSWNVSATRLTRAIFPGRYVAQMGYECSDDNGFTDMATKDIEINLVAPADDTDTDPTPEPTSNRAPVFKPLDRGVDSTPTVSASAADGVVNYRYNIATDYEDGEITNYYADGVLASRGQSHDPIARTFSWNPGAGDIGTFTIKFYAKDSGGKTDMRKLTITVVP